MARLLTPGGDRICDLYDLDVEGATVESGATFSAVVPEGLDSVVIRSGAALVEMDDGTRYPGEVGRAEVTTESGGAVVRVSGVLIAMEPG